MPIIWYDSGSSQVGLLGRFFYIKIWEDGTMKVFRFFVFFILLMPVYALLSAVIFIKAGVGLISLISISGLTAAVYIVFYSVWPGWKEILGRRCPLCHEKYLPHFCPRHGKIVHKNELP